MVGRSNVGKSSLINALTGCASRAPAPTPGKTRLVNIFRVAGADRAPVPAGRPAGLRLCPRREGPGVRGPDGAYFLARREYFSGKGAGHRACGRPAPGRRAAPGTRQRCGRLRLAGRHGDRPAAVVATKIDKLTRAERTRVSARSNQRSTDRCCPSRRHSGEGLEGPVETDRTATQQPPAKTDTPPQVIDLSTLKDMSVSGADPDRQAARGAGRHRHAQAGADLRDPARARREERAHLLGRRARDAARRLRLPARARLQLPAGPDDVYVSPSQIGSSTCTPATPSPARSGRRRRASATSR
jgi:hypothetical protein